MSDKPNNTQALLNLRDEIDGIDKQIHTLLNQRATCAQKVAEAKLQDDPNAIFYRPEREAQVLRKIQERNQGPLADEDVARLFRQIMSACLSLEKSQKVAFLGPEGTFCQSAAIKHFGDWMQSMPMTTIDEVFREVEAGACEYGVVPVENSTEGVINYTLDSFLNSNLKISGEVELRIHHNLMTAKTNDPKNITRIYSHQQSLAQCRKWLDAKYPNAERVAVNSNAEAAKRVMSEWNSAAIAGEMAAEQYDLLILNDKIEDKPDNSTRFLVIGRSEVQTSGKDKTSLIISMKNQPGALFNILKPFKDLKVDLTRVETRPSSSSTWAYVFFIDFLGHLEDENIQKLMQQIKQTAADVKVLGSYPVAVI
ncbi:prephenate dehydratase [Marinicellulosiphila megalodicopiae]|uniref:prephenate dehydratase n=1 Tax=Marinicellulosiphila megalodicopiae TaxID=2724896 RepID=UPI003BAFC5D4